MAKISNEKRAQLQGEIAQLELLGNLDVEELATRHEVSKSVIYNIRNRMGINAPQKRDIKQSRLQPDLLDKFVSNVEKAELPFQAKANAMKVVDSARSLAILETNFHDTFNKVLKQANRMMENEDLALSEWQIITTTLASAFKDIYNTTGTTINVQQNGTEGTENNLTLLKGRMGA